MDIAVSIIIVNYNSQDVLESCLSSVKEKVKNLSYEIIVVDNDSVKGSLNDLQQKYPEVFFILQKSNLGFGSANNTGVKQTRGRYIYFLNPDTELINDAVSILSDYMDIHQEVGICGGSMFNEDSTPTTSFYDIDMLKLEYEIMFHLRKNYKGINNTNLPKNVLVIVGSNLFIRKDIFDTLGGFDDDFFMYFEEMELCHRVANLGFDIVSVPDAKIMHLHGATGENKNEELKTWLYEIHWYSKWLYFYKTKGHTQTTILYNAHKIKTNLAVAIFKLKGKKDKIDYWSLKKNAILRTYERYLQKNKI